MTKANLPFLALLTFAMTCGAASAQNFNVILPSDLGLGLSETGINQTVDISSFLGLQENSVSLTIFNGNVNDTFDAWTVSESQSTSFSLSGQAVEAFVSHGQNLGSEAAQNGSLSRDGITALDGETWRLVSNLDDDYTAGTEDNDFFVDYTGPETNQLESNSEGFRWESEGPTGGVTVFSSNTQALNNNFTIGFSVVAVPEPSSGMLLALGGLAFLRRRRS